MTTETPPPTETPPTQRSRARRNVVGRSPQRDEYVRLMEAGWSSLALERYAAYRYGEEIPASTFRTFKSRKGIEVKVSPFKSVDPDSIIDVVQKRSELIQLQEARIQIDVEHERSMGKLFGSTRQEVACMSALLDAHKADLQDLGVMPKAGEKLEINDSRPAGPAAEDAPRARTLSDLLGSDPEREMELARVIHLALPAAPSQAG